jgi:hypothetical protein
LRFGHGHYAHLEFNPTPAILTYACGAFLAFNLLLAGHDVVGKNMGGAALAQRTLAYLKAQNYPHNTPLYFVQMYDQTLPFYLQRTATLVQHADELEFGLKQQPELWLPTLEAWKAAWDKDKQAIAAMRPAAFDALKGNVAMREIARDARRVVVVKP